MKILCVDDSTYNLFVIREIISQIDAKIHIETALNGQIAHDKIFDAHQIVQDNALNKGNFYDLVLLDLHMPLLDGFQVRINNFVKKHIIDSENGERIHNKRCHGIRKLENICGVCDHRVTIQK